LFVETNKCTIINAYFNHRQANLSGKTEPPKNFEKKQFMDFRQALASCIFANVEAIHHFNATIELIWFQKTWCRISG